MKACQNKEVYRRLCEVIPGGVNSPARAWRGIAEAPLIAKRAKGSTLWDANDRAYIDYCQSWGALIHGHAYAPCVAAAAEYTERGSSFGMSTEIEWQLAQRVSQLVPSIEQVRFVSSGTEATMSAARLARGFTQRPLLVKFTGNYHGHADFFLVQAGSGVAGLTPTSSSDGIPQELVQDTVCLPYNDVAALHAFFASEQARHVAAVIVEPIACNMGVVPASAAFMRALREETQKAGALLIFDEVITGFRCSPRGAQELYSEQPDLTCYGKIIGGGFPAAAFGGSREIMQCLAPEGTVYQAGTLSGNPVAMACGAAALDGIMQSGFYEDLERKTRVITDAVAEVIADLGLKACIKQVGSLFTLFFGQTDVQCFKDVQSCDLAAFRSFFHHMMQQGILVSPSQFEACFVSAAHSQEELERTRDAITAFLRQHVRV